MAGHDLVTIAAVDEVPPGTLKVVHAGDETFALANVDGAYYAVQGACLHLGGPLGEGRLDGHFVRCPWHGWTYDVRTGKNDFDLAIELETYDVAVEDGEIKLAVG